MTDAPERIWAIPERNGTITAQDGPFARHHGAASEYVRADLVEALEAENQRLQCEVASYHDAYEAERTGRAAEDKLPQTENQRLREALRPFGDAADHAIKAVGKTTTLGVLGALAPYFVSWQDFIRARAALRNKGSQDE